MLEEVERVVGAAVVFAHLGAHEVDAVGDAASCERRVAALWLRESLARMKGLVDGGALGFVDR